MPSNSTYLFISSRLQPIVLSNQPLESAFKYVGEPRYKVLLATMAGPDMAEVEISNCKSKKRNEGSEMGSIQDHEPLNASRMAALDHRIPQQWKPSAVKPLGSESIPSIVEILGTRDPW